MVRFFDSNRNSLRTMARGTGAYLCNRLSVVHIDRIGCSTKTLDFSVKKTFVYVPLTHDSACPHLFMTILVIIIDFTAVPLVTH